MAMAMTMVIVNGIEEMQVFDGGHILGFQDPSMWPTVIEFLS